MSNRKVMRIHLIVVLIRRCFYIKWGIFQNHIYTHSKNEIKVDLDFSNNFFQKLVFYVNFNYLNEDHILIVTIYIINYALLV